jgi:hypothetical protein
MTAEQENCDVSPEGAEENLRQVVGQSLVDKSPVARTPVLEIVIPFEALDLHFPATSDRPLSTDDRAND